MADFALDLHSTFSDVDATVATVAAYAVKVLPGVTAAGVTRIGRDRVLTCLAATNPQVLQMMQGEQRTNSGPCLYVLNRANPPNMVIEVMDGDGDDQRWLQYMAEAVSIGVAAVMAVRLDDGAGAAGHALLLLSDSGFDRSLGDGIDVFAAHAAVAVTQARKQAELTVALHSRDLIGQAKGILMERHQVGSDAAFMLLSKMSQDTNTPLRQVAERIATGNERQGGTAA